MSPARVTLEPLDVDRDLGLLHAWVTHPRSVFWDMQGATPDEVAREYTRIADDPHHDAWLGRADGVPAFLAETYDPGHSELADLPEVRPGDLGMHVLVAPPTSPVPGFTRAVMRAVMEHCFADPDVRRVVVEPDVRNDRIAVLNAAAGFRVVRSVALPTKKAALSFCTRDAFSASDLANDPANETGHRMTHHPPHPEHLTPERLDRAQRHLLAKAIGEFAHERMLLPEAVGDGVWRLTSPAGDTTYTFRARRFALDHWQVDPVSIERAIKEEPADPDVSAFVAENADRLGIPDALLPVYLEELAGTLASAMWKLRHSTRSVRDLARADYQEVEAAMTEGHPAFVANNGRIGFGIEDHAAYAPETGQPVKLVWVAARRSVARLSVGRGLTEEALYDGELGHRGLSRLRGRIRDLGLDPADYLLVPVHPWQWRQKLAITFAPDLARHDLVFLGEGPSEHQAQQSIRTFFDPSHPERHYVKTALSIQNMGFMRGLSPAYMEATPAINDWVADLVEGDRTLRGCGFSILRERAAVGYTGDAYHDLHARRGTTSAYRKMLAALWRESPVPRLAPDERLMTMAALLHRDARGEAIATELVYESGGDGVSWLRSYLHAYLRPIIHCLLAHDLAFMPHGENLVLVVRDGLPVRAILKDVGEEVAVMSPTRPLPDDVARIRVDVDPDLRSLAVHTDVFDGFLRFLAAILVEDGVIEEGTFWREVGRCVARHRDEHPELAEASAAYDFFRPRFRHSCLNRLQLRNTLEMVDLTDQAASLMYAGTLGNPIAGTDRVVERRS